MTPTAFTCFRSSDANATIDLLTALGFTEKLVVRADDRPDVVVHAQFDWRHSGGLMFGSKAQTTSTGKDSEDFNCIGSAAIYLVAEDDDEVRRLHELITQRDDTIVRDISEPPYGGLEFAFTDSDGNSFSIGSYPGE